jgi:hypothetical protein
MNATIGIDLGHPDGDRTVIAYLVPMKPSRKQQDIIRSAKMNGFITLKEAVCLVGGDVYANADKHTGAILSNMVKRGMLIRVKPGTFKLPEQEQTLTLK